MLEEYLYPDGLTKIFFPKSWCEDKIMHYISDIATDPNVKWIQQTGKNGAKHTKDGRPVRFRGIGNREGVDILTIIEPDGEGIITGYPLK